MNKLLVLTMIFLIPSATAAMSHSPNEVSEGKTFTAIIDVDDDVKEVTFYVCTLEEPYTCYKPEKKDRNDSINGRYQFSYTVKSNDYPGYKYELVKEDNETYKIPQAHTKYDGLEVEEMQDSLYFKVNVQIEETSDSAGESLFRGYWIYAIVMVVGFLIFSFKK